MDLRRSLRGSSWVALVALSLVAASCAEPTSEDGEAAAHQRLGTVGLALQVAPGVVLNAIDYAIVGPGVMLNGTLQVPGTSSTFSATISDIPAGQGYQLQLTSYAVGDAGIGCVGSAAFDVVAGGTTQVHVTLLCDEAQNSGTAKINGAFNICPAVSSSAVSPVQQAVGATVAVTLAVRDVDHGPFPIAYAWTSSTGTLANATSATPTFTCTQAGPVTLSYTIADGSCSKTGSLAVTCVAAAGTDAGLPFDAGLGNDSGADAGASAAHVVINEVESNGGVPDDWTELYNAGTQPVDISNWGFKDNDDTHTLYRIPAGTVIAPGGYYVLEVAQFVFGLGAADSARLYAADGVSIVDSYSWTAHALSTYGRCPNGTGPFVQTTTSKGAANICPATTDGGTDAGSAVGDASADAGADADLPWPGPSTVLEVDPLNAYASNLSGLSYQAGATVASSVLWGVQNGPSMLYRLVDNGTLYVNSTDNGWGAGKTIFYPNGMGGPDSEGVVYVAGDAPGTGSLYVSTERDNTVNTVSRLSVLQYDANAAGTTLTALREWNLTSDLPVVGPNLGLEGVTFVSDAELAAQAFREGNGQPYNQTRFAQHGGGVFLVGVEGTGMIHVYAFNHADQSYARLSSFSSGMPAVMDLAYDPDTNYLWAYGDDTQGNRAVLFEIEASMASLSYGQFVQRKVLAKPAGLPPVNNEGISFAPDSECAGGQRRFFWADDNATGGHSLRRGSIPCGRSY